MPTFVALADAREPHRLAIAARLPACVALTALALVGLAHVGHGLWIHAKARLAQALLERSWSAAVAAGDAAAATRPWPWADQRPVARLRAPGHGVDLLVLAAADPRSLAFGPGLMSAESALDHGGHVAIAGHRDTHFRFLAELAPGDPVELETASGASRRYRVTDHAVVDRGDTALLADPGALLTLVTCWPFDAVAPGGRERFVVRAVAERTPANPPPSGRGP